MSKLPDISPAEVETALRRFDSEYRDTPRWQTWPSRADKNGIAWDGRLYPVKFIIHLATGREVASFFGGPEANAYLIRRGFEIVRLRPDEDLAGPKVKGYLIHALLLQDGPRPTLCQRDGNQWVVFRAGELLSREGVWETESTGPGVEHLTCYDSLGEALTAWEQWKQAQEEA
jgi:hypothetical protein